MSLGGQLPPSQPETPFTVSNAQVFKGAEGESSTRGLVTFTFKQTDGTVKEYTMKINFRKPVTDQNIQANALKYMSQQKNIDTVRTWLARYTPLKEMYKDADHVILRNSSAGGQQVDIHKKAKPGGSTPEAHTRTLKLNPQEATHKIEKWQGKIGVLKNTLSPDADKLLKLETKVAKLHSLFPGMPLPAARPAAAERAASPPAAPAAPTVRRPIPRPRPSPPSAEVPHGESTSPASPTVRRPIPKSLPKPPSPRSGGYASCGLLVSETDGRNAAVPRADQ